ncbi:hypothetical protein WR164_07620 [Philodulcilactobacillus myokoensis]|uniref:DUF910 family protein n=1 Tax=Philodulcilactobacillus myokoensis TaxID=2929573 RepID=A0A9W6B1P7_9LACO|nr:YqgQ family protein [Philodulcilactobacillus myokoensis]GLB46783.1 hypothetical protein WR164_07620 [Philodulcilactobacillus myokoensis]
MKTLYDVQQLLEKFGIVVYVGKRIWDIEVMAMELDHLHEARLVSDKQFINAKLILTKEHRYEEHRQNNNHRA